MSSFLDYLRDLSDGGTNSDFAHIAGVNKSTVGRWDTTPPSVDAVRALARHYARPILEVMIAAGIVDDREVQTAAAPLRLDSLSNYALLREVSRRMDGMSDTSATLTPPTQEEDPNPDDYRLAAGHVARPDDRHAD